jgi:hypothetical protein
LLSEHKPHHSRIVVCRVNNQIGSVGLEADAEGIDHLGHTVTVDMIVSVS